MDSTDSTSDGPADPALLDDLERDVQVAMDDLEMNPDQAVRTVVADSDFVAPGERPAVIDALLARF